MLRLWLAALALIVGLPAASAPQARPMRWPAHATISVWLDPRAAPAGAGALIDKALATWTRAADGRFTLQTVSSRDAAQIRIQFAQADGIYGEAAPRVDRSTGYIGSAEVVLAEIGGGDALERRIILYLTALHEVGHALGLPHTDAFDDIMYSFRRPDDGERYFGAYRRKLRSSDDIGTDRATGLSPADVAALRSLYDR